MRTATRLACASIAAALAALVAACTDAPAPPVARAAGGTVAAASALTNRVWIRTSPDSPLGSMLIFLSDGTLLQDSCGETYRLSRWRADDPDTIRWQEDTAEIRATVVKLTEADLTLRLDLVSGVGTATYVAATVPYVCPDLPR
jgi:hypothetical protein